MQWCIRVVNTQLSLTCGKKNPSPPKSSNSKLSRYNNQNASFVPTCHILKCFPCYISSVCCIDMTENWSRQPFIDLPSGMKNCVLTWTELVHRSFPSLADIPERGKTLPGKRNPKFPWYVIYVSFFFLFFYCLHENADQCRTWLQTGWNFKTGKTQLQPELGKGSGVATVQTQEKPHGRLPSMFQNRIKILVGTCNLLHIRRYNHKTWFLKE